MRRGNIVDEVVVDGETVVMIEDTVMVLGPVAARVWDLLAEGEVPDMGVRDQLSHEFGMTEDSVWRDLCDVLSASGLTQ